MIWVIIAILIFLVVMFIRYMNYQDKKHQELMNELFKEQEKEERAKRKSLGINKPSKVISDGAYDKYRAQISIYKKKGIIEINGEYIKFNDILDYECCLMRKGGKVVSTSTSSVLKRVAVGGLLFGGAGAIIGATTAKKKIKDDEEIYYRINLTLNDLDNPLFFVNTEHEYVAKELCAILNIIQNSKAEH